MLILPSLIRVENESCVIWYLFKCFIKHIHNLPQYWMFADGVADDFSIIHIQYRRQIKFFSKQAEFCDISCLFLIWHICFKITLNDVWCNLSGLSSVRAILFESYHTFNSQFFHQSMYCLMIYSMPTVMKFYCDSTVSISSLVFVINSRDQLFYFLVFIRCFYPFKVIVVGTSWHTHKL